jgi:arginase family enzyme
MDELKAYLNPVDISPNFIGVEKANSLFSKVISLHQKKCDIGIGDIVIVGVNESRNSSNPLKQNSPNTIRQYLYGLSTFPLKGKIIDAGNIVDTDSPAKTYAALTSVISLFLQKKATLVILGGTQELTECIYRGYRSQKEYITLSIIDSHIDSNNDNEDFHSLNYLNKLLSEDTKSLFDLSIIGYQGYFVDNEKIDRYRNLNHELLRLGYVRGNYREVEPTLRNSDIVSFDMGVIRSSDSPGNLFPSPNGLYAEEACQLTRYAGSSERVSCFGIFEYAPDNDPTRQSALLAAQLVWHFLEGTAQRKMENSLDDIENTKKFIVNSGTPGVDLIFYRNELSDNWWLELPFNMSSNNKLTIPCSPNDYVIAGKQDVPERWLRFLHKVQSLKNSGK